MTPSRVKDLTEFPQNAKLMESLEPQVSDHQGACNSDQYSCRHLHEAPHEKKPWLPQEESTPNFLNAKLLLAQVSDHGAYKLYPCNTDQYSWRHLHVARHDSRK